MKEILETLEKAKKIQERTAKRLERMISPTGHGFDFASDGIPASVDHVHDTTKVQVLYLTIHPNVTCDEHSHTSSNETFIVALGSIIYDGVEYIAGETLVVPAQTPHKVKGGPNGGECVVVLVPPERAYTSS